jgi:hypothetical protein
MRTSLRSASVALAASGLFGSLVVLLHFLRPELAPGWHMLSEYSVGPWGFLMRLAFVALAASFVSLTLALRDHAPGPIGTAGRYCLAVAALGAMLGGLFNTDPPGTAPEQASTTGMLHGFAFMLGVPGVLLAVTLLGAALWRAPAWRSARVLLAGSAALVWVTLLVFANAMSGAVANHASGADFAVGWQNRASVLAWVVWAALLAWRARAIGQNRSTTLAAVTTV